MIYDLRVSWGNAIAALHFIRKHKFDQMCFVGRPDPSMVYFKTNGRRRFHIEVIDPRRLEAAIDPPRWWDEQRGPIAELAPSVDLADDHPTRADNPRQIGSLTIETADAKATEIVERHGIKGLAVGTSTKIRFGTPAAVVDVGVAHFGEAPTVVAHTDGKVVAEATVDERQRQTENVRLSGKRIDQVTITSPDGTAILNFVHVQPTTARKRIEK